jgi:hypothetical protein
MRLGVFVIALLLLLKQGQAKGEQQTLDDVLHVHSGSLAQQNRGTIVGDLDNDGRQDLVQRDWSGEHYRFFKNVAGEPDDPIYEEQMHASDPFAFLDFDSASALSIADVDGDGTNDLLVGTPTPGDEVLIYLGHGEANGRPTFALPLPLKGVKAADGGKAIPVAVTNTVDQSCDVVVRNEQSGKLSYFRAVRSEIGITSESANPGVNFNELTGTSNPLSNFTSTFGPIPVDKDQDGDTDLLIEMGGQVKLLRNTGSSFAEVARDAYKRVQEIGGDNAQATEYLVDSDHTDVAPAGTEWEDAGSLIVKTRNANKQYVVIPLPHKESGQNKLLPVLGLVLLVLFGVVLYNQFRTQYLSAKNAKKLDELIAGQKDLQKSINLHFRRLKRDLQQTVLNVAEVRAPVCFVLLPHETEAENIAAEKKHTELLQNKDDIKGHDDLDDDILRNMRDTLQNNLKWKLKTWFSVEAEQPWRETSRKMRRRKMRTRC